MITRLTVFSLGMACALPTSLSAQEANTDNAWKATITRSGGDTGAPPRFDPLRGANAPLSRKEKRGVAYGRQWADNRDMPARGEDGSTVFTFGATLPAVVCAPLFVCDLVLQEGETVNDLNIGDSVRWQISPATQGAGEKAITHVIIKPSDVGLATNLIVTTNRRAYTIKLLSARNDWMPRVAFAYPDDVRAQWGALRDVQQRQREAQAAAEEPKDTGRVDFTYALSGDEPSWRPARVFASGSKTYIQFPEGALHEDLPALVALADDGGLFTEPTQELVAHILTNINLRR